MSVLLEVYIQSVKDLTGMSLDDVYVVLGALLNSPLRNDKNLSSLWRYWGNIRRQEKNEEGIHTVVIDYLYKAMSGNVQQSWVESLDECSALKKCSALDKLLKERDELLVKKSNAEFELKKYDDESDFIKKCMRELFDMDEIESLIEDNHASIIELVES